MAALLLSQDPTLKPTQIKELILASVDRLPTLAGKIATGGRVNAYSALLALRGRGKTSLIAQRPVSLMQMIASPEASTQ